MPREEHAWIGQRLGRPFFLSEQWKALKKHNTIPPATFFFFKNLKELSTNLRGIEKHKTHDYKIILKI